MNATPRYRRLWVLVACVVAVSWSVPNALLRGVRPIDRSGTVLAVDPSSGDEMWRVSSRPKTYFQVQYGLGNLVYAQMIQCSRSAANVNGPNARDLTSYPATMVVLDRNTGNEVWRKPIRIGSLWSEVGNTAPSGSGAGASDRDLFGVGTSAVVVMGRDGRLQGLDPKSGRRLWRHALGGFEPAGGTAERLILRSASHPGTGSSARQDVQAVDRRTGLVQWTYPMSGFDTVEPIVGDDTVVVRYTKTYEQPFSFKAMVVALDAATGLERWRNDELIHARLTMVGPRLVAIASFGKIRGYDLTTGALSWQTTGPTAYLRASGAGVVVFTTPEEQAIALDAADGSTLWKRADTTGADAVTRGGEHLLVVGTEAATIALDIATGQQVWRRDAEPFGGGYGPHGLYFSKGCYVPGVQL